MPDASEQHMGMEDFQVEEDAPDIQRTVERFSELKEIEKARKTLYEAAKDVRLEHEAALYVMLENAGFQNVKTEYGTAFRKVMTFMSIPGEHKTEGHQWLKENGLGDLIQPTVNSRTLTAALKDFQEEGKELPDYININIKNQVGLRKAG